MDGTITITLVVVWPSQRLSGPVEIMKLKSSMQVLVTTIHSCFEFEDKQMSE